MIKIRLSRQGAKNAPFYRIVAVEEYKKRSARAIDKIGTWDPRKDTKSIDKEKLKMWVSKGAVVTPAVKKLI